MVGWHHRFDEHEFEQALGAGDGQGSLVCCSPCGCKESDMTEQLNWTELNWRFCSEKYNRTKSYFFLLTENQTWQTNGLVIVLKVDSSWTEYQLYIHMYTGNNQLSGNWGPILTVFQFLWCKYSTVLNTHHKIFEKLTISLYGPVWSGFITHLCIHLKDKCIYIRIHTHIYVFMLLYIRHRNEERNITVNKSIFSKFTAVLSKGQNFTLHLMSF